MFQNNPLLSQLKQQIRESKLRVEGTVKATDKNFGFLECDKKSYFLPPNAMKKVMHGDKIKAVIEQLENSKEQAEPEELITPFLTRFIGRLGFNKKGQPQVFVDHPNIRHGIFSSIDKQIDIELKESDWVVAQLTHHPMLNNGFPKAKITEFICRAEDEFAPWWVTLARHQQSRYPVEGLDQYPLLDENIERLDLTHLHFVTIDSSNTQDMDDALYIEALSQEGKSVGYTLWVAIADPSAYISESSIIEQQAKQRCFTHYLPGFNIPMLPRKLSDELCSLMPFCKRPALACQITLNLQGQVIQPVQFHLAWIESKAKLSYCWVSDYLEHKSDCPAPKSAEIQQQIELLHQFALVRIQWRQQHALSFKERPDYQFILNEKGKVTHITAEYRRIGNAMVEEAMILANICAADYLNEHVGYGIFNTHNGFDKKFLPHAEQFLHTQFAHLLPENKLNDTFNKQQLSTLEGYCHMRHFIDSQPHSNYLELRLRRFLTFAEFKSEKAPHFGLGLNGYATWTSPIRKYSDIVNHRLIKASLTHQSYSMPQADLLLHLQEARKQNRNIERDIADWLYCLYLAPNIANKPQFQAEIQDVMRAGLRVQLIENGANVFIPASTLHAHKEEMHANLDELVFYINNEATYKIGDIITIQLIEINIDNRSILGEIIL